MIVCPISTALARDPSPLSEEPPTTDVSSVAGLMDVTERSAKLKTSQVHNIENLIAKYCILRHKNNPVYDLLT